MDVVHETIGDLILFESKNITKFLFKKQRSESEKTTPQTKKQEQQDQE
jgi:hypothetical protein